MLSRVHTESRAKTVKLWNPMQASMPVDVAEVWWQGKMEGYYLEKNALLSHQALSHQQFSTCESLWQATPSQCRMPGSEKPLCWQRSMLEAVVALHSEPNSVVTDQARGGRKK